MPDPTIHSNETTTNEPLPALVDRAVETDSVAYEVTAGRTLLVTGVDPAMVGKIAAAEGIALDELTGVRDSLEDVFLRLTHDATEYESGAS